MFIVANWKSNKTEEEGLLWFSKLKKSITDQELDFKHKAVIVCPSFTFLSALKFSIECNNLHIRLGAQDISSFEEGSYTGEVSGKQIKELASFVIIGHSERRKNFHEDEEMIFNKIIQALNHDLILIVCISDINQAQELKVKIKNYRPKLKEEMMVIAYEPIFAIGTGQPDTPENADSMALAIKKELGDIPVLYGGSVNSKNVNDFTKMENIDGVLVGTASLDPLEFLEIIKNA